MEKGIIKLNKEREGRYKLSFWGKITANTFFNDQCWGEKQAKLHDLPEQVPLIVNMVEVDWFDALALIYVLLSLHKIKSRVEICFDSLNCGDDIEKARFHLFLYETGFLDDIAQLVNKSLNEICNMDEIERHKRKILASTYDFCPTIFPIKVVDKKGRVLEDVYYSIKKQMAAYNYNEGQRVLSIIAPALQECVDNVFEHAYNDDEIPYYCIYIRFINYGKVLERREQEQQAEREKIYSKMSGSLWNMKYHDGQLFDKYLENIFLSEGTYVNGEEIAERKNVIQVFIADIGKGIAESFGRSERGLDRNIIESIFSEGERSKKKTKNTKVGGLSMIKHLFEDDNNYIAVKGDYNWIRNLCSKSKPEVNYISNNGKLEPYKSQGTALVFEINLRENGDNLTLQQIGPNTISKEIYSSDFKILYNKLLVSSYKEEKLECIDIRDNKCCENNIKNKREEVLLVGSNIKKNVIVKYLYEIDDMERTDTLIIGEIPDMEWKKYHYILEKAHALRHFNKIITITETFNSAVFEKGNAGYIYSQKKTKEYINANKNAAPISKYLYSYIVWLKWYDSKIIWKDIIIGDYYINKKVQWEENVSILGYLDFFSMMMNQEIRKRMSRQLIRLKAYYQNIKFVAIDRLTEDICNELNNTMNNSEEEKSIIGVGSVYVTGNTEEQKQCKERYYFFQHCSSNENVNSLYDWFAVIDPEDKRLETYYRVGKTPFISKEGDNYFKMNHYKNMKNNYVLLQSQLYQLIQEYAVNYGTRTCMGHINMIDRHDMLHVDMYDIFNGERNWNYSIAKEQYNTINMWDFVWMEIACAISAEINLQMFAMETETLKELFQKKLQQYVKKENKELKDGIVIYSTDYQTRKIIEKTENVFSDKYRGKIIPISPFVRNRPAASLLTSPQYLEHIKGIIEKQDTTIEGKKSVLIFFAESISTRLRTELEHIMYSLGATDVRTLSLIDRTRMPLGSDNRKAIKAFCKMDLPTARNNNACLLCKGREILREMLKTVGVESLKRNIEILLETFDIEKNLEGQTAYGIAAKPEQLPEEIKDEVNKICRAYGTGNIDIWTDFGLVLFSIESTVISLSSRFLMLCVDNEELSDNIKILLLCAQLYHFLKQELTGDVQRKCIEKLLQICRSKGEEDVHDQYLAMGIFVLLALSERNTNIYKEFLYDVSEKKDYVRTPNSVLFIFYLTLYSKLSQSYKIWDFEGLLINPNESVLDTMYGIVLHTQMQCEHTHSNTSYRIYTEAAIPSQKVDALLLEIQYLNFSYQRIPERYRNDATNFERILRMLEREEEYINQYKANKIPTSEFNDKIKDWSQKLLVFASQINKENFIRITNEWRDFEKNLKLVAENVVNERHMGRCGLLSNIQVVVHASNQKRLFYYNRDIETELGYLMSDFRHASQYNIEDTSDDIPREYDGIVEVLFRQNNVLIKFMNVIDEACNIDEIRKQKNNKISRPSHLIFDMLNQHLDNGTVNPSYMLEKDEKKRNIFVAEIQLPYLDL